jgi:hypothetical protein
MKFPTQDLLADCFLQFLEQVLHSLHVRAGFEADNAKFGFCLVRAARCLIIDASLIGSAFKQKIADDSVVIDLEIFDVHWIEFEDVPVSVFPLHYSVRQEFEVNLRHGLGSEDFVEGLEEVAVRAGKGRKSLTE